MKSYKLEGFYVHNGTRGSLTGIVNIDPKGALFGQVIDYGSASPNQLIQGEIKDNSTLAFFKFPRSSSLANLFYMLRKQEKDKVAGRYIGKWHALPLKVDVFNKNDITLLIARYDTQVLGIGGEVEIILS